MADLLEAFPHTVHGKFVEGSYDVSHHDEVDVYGTPHTMVYNRYEQPFGSVVITFIQGGALRQNEGFVHVRASDLGDLDSAGPVVFAEGRYPYADELTEPTARMIGDSLVKQVADKI